MAGETVDPDLRNISSSQLIHVWHARPFIPLKLPEVQSAPLLAVQYMGCMPFHLERGREATSGGTVKRFTSET
jgi:hypothetical protein